MHGLVTRLASALDVRTGVIVGDVTPVGGGFVVAGERCDALVLATHASSAARLLGDLAPAAGRELAGYHYASPVVVTLAFEPGDVPDEVRAASGFLVPPVDGRAVKASTFTTTKWGRDDPLVYLRTSLGRAGEEAGLQRPDAELVDRSLTDLRAAVGLAAAPVDTHVQRWGGGLPQYEVGHLDRVARIRSDVERVPGLAVCGAAYDGVGVAACIGSGRAAAARILVGTMRT